MAVFEDGLAGTTTTTGTGSYTVAANITGYRPISQLADGQSRVFVIRTATDFEVGLYTKSGGSTPVLARTTIYMNVSGGTSAVNWTTGEKTIHSTVSAAILGATSSADIRTANLLMRGFTLALDTDDNSGFYSDANDNVVAKVGGVEFWRLFSTAPPIMRVLSSDAGSGVGPIIQMDRNSTSPAANDSIGGLWYVGRDTGGNSTNYARIEGVISDPTNGSEDGGILISVPRAGVDTSALHILSTTMAIYPSIQSSTQGVTIGKFSQSLNTVGVELWTTGFGAFTTDNFTTLLLNRKNTDGQLVTLQRDNVEVGSISVISGVITYGTFIGHHLSSGIDELPPIGAVLCTMDERFEPEGRGHLARVRLSTSRADKRVYGAFAGYDEHGAMICNGLGAWQVLVTGPVEGGDLLQSSQLPGVAERQPDDLIRSCTIGKVTIGDDRTDVRAVPCTLYCG